MAKTRQGTAAAPAPASRDAAGGGRKEAVQAREEEEEEEEEWEEEREGGQGFLRTCSAPLSSPVKTEGDRYDKQGAAVGGGRKEGERERGGAEDEQGFLRTCSAPPSSPVKMTGDGLEGRGMDGGGSGGGGNRFNIRSEEMATLRHPRGGTWQGWQAHTWDSRQREGAEVLAKYLEFRRVASGGAGGGSAALTYAKRADIAHNIARYYPPHCSISAAT